MDKNSTKIIRESPIFVRVDDVGCDDLPNIRNIVAVCKKTKIPVILGVIPGHLSDETVIYLQRELQENWPYLIIAQHGVHHIPHPGYTRKMEFSLTELVDDIVAKLLTGKSILEKKIGIAVNWYIPPWNKYGRNLISALEKIGYEAFSASTRVPFRSNSLINFPINQDVIIDAETGKIELDPQVWLEETKINLSKEGKSGLMLHHHLMDERHIRTFKEWAVNCRSYLS